MAKIRHIAIVTDVENIERLAAFYVDVFGMEVTQRYEGAAGKIDGMFMTDGYMQVALLTNPDRKKGPHHFGFTLDEDEQPIVHEKLKQYGISLFKPPVARPYVEDGFIDVDGNKVDLTTDVLRSKEATLAKRGA